MKPLPRPLTAPQLCIFPTDVLLGTDLWPWRSYWQPVSYSYTHTHTLKYKQGPSALSPLRPKTHTWTETGQNLASSTQLHTHTHTNRCTYTHIHNGQRLCRSTQSAKEDTHTHTHRCIKPHTSKHGHSQHNYRCEPINTHPHITDNMYASNASFEVNMRPQGWERVCVCWGGFPPPPLWTCWPVHNVYVHVPVFTVKQ